MENKNPHECKYFWTMGHAILHSLCSDECTLCSSCWKIPVNSSIKSILHYYQKTKIWLQLCRKTIWRLGRQSIWPLFLPTHIRQSPMYNQYPKLLNQRHPTLDPPFFCSIHFLSWTIFSCLEFDKESVTRKCNNWSIVIS